MESEDRTKMIILTGMKKAGKPVVLKEIIRGVPKERSLGIIINEREGYSPLGRLRKGERPGGGIIHIEEFIPECISCSYRVGMGTVLRKFLKEHSPDVLLVNTPGVIDPKVLTEVVETIQKEYAICLCGELLAVHPPEFNRIYGKLPFTTSQVQSATWVGFSSAFLKDSDCSPDSEDAAQALHFIKENAQGCRRICKIPEDKKDLLSDIYKVLLG